MIKLLERTIYAHGGLDRSKGFRYLKAKIKADGAIWAMKGQPGIFYDVDVSVDLLKQEIELTTDQFRATYSPDNILALTEIGKPVQELTAPRSSFAEYGKAETWTWLQAIYFLGYTLWSHVQVPILFLKPGFHVIALGPWREKKGETWQRLQVNFPDNIAAHSRSQTFYIGRDGLIKRQDYQMDIAGGTPIAQYLEDYVQVPPFRLPTILRAYVRKEDNMPMLDQPLLVSIHQSNLQPVPVNKVKQHF